MAEMDTNEDATVERIAAAIQGLQRRGGGTRDGTKRDLSGLRLYRTRDGEFVRVLDDDAAPLSAEMIRAIEAYTSGRLAEGAALEDADVPPAAEVEDAATSRLPSTPGTIQPYDKSQACLSAPVLQTNDVKDSSVDDDGDVAMADESELLIPAVQAKEEAKEKEADAAVLPQQQEQVQVQEETIESLMARGISASSWLNGDEVSTDANPPEPMDDVFCQPPGHAFDVAHAHRPVFSQMILDQWPLELRPRTRICFTPPPAAAAASIAASITPSSSATPFRCVLYWMRNTFRVSHGNFALSAAHQLAKQHEVPVVVVSLLPSSILYPVRHASGINDALTRWSVSEVRRKLHDQGIELFAFTPTVAVSQQPQSTPQPTPLDGGSALYSLFNAFSPVAVITDDSFSLSARTELDCLRQHLATIHSSSSSWMLIAVDSMACVPFASQCDAVRKSLEVDTAQFLSEDAFASEYGQLLQQCGPLASSFPDPTTIAITTPFPRPILLPSALLASVMNKLQVDRVCWDIVEPMNAQFASSVAVSSESKALERLESLVAVADDRPAIQQELQGGGILSLLPYIRHGTLFAGFVVDKLAAVIASRPPPTDAKSRKALAMLKVLRSRASTHLAKERDYVLYLSLWASRQEERELQLRTGKATSFRALCSFQTAMSELDTYKHILPSWISPVKHLTGTGSLLKMAYDPYQLESARTDDPYWNDIQLFLLETRYIHPLVVLYWAYRIFQWSVSTQAAIVTIESLLDKCSLGSSQSPDTIFSVWLALFRVGKSSSHKEDEETSGQFISRVQEELSNQQKLQIRK